MTGQPAFDFGQLADRAAMGYLRGRISRKPELASLPAADIGLGPLSGRGRRCSGFFNLAREAGWVNGNLPELKGLEFWLNHVRQVQAHDWSQQ